LPPRTEVHKYNAEGVLPISELLHSGAHDRNQSALEEGDEPAHEPKERTMVVSKLTDGLGHVEAGSKVIENIDLNE